MKNLSFIYLIFWLVCGCFYSCSDETLSSDRTGETPVHIVYNDSVRTNQFVINIYSFLPDGFNRMGGNSMVASATDEAVHAVPGSGAQNWGEGNWTATTLRDDNLSDFCTGIRRSFVFEEQIYSHISILVMSEGGQKQLLAQVQFLRAYFNFELLKRYGGYPLVKRVYTMDEDLNFQRNTYDECVEYIVGLCDDAARELPVSYPDNQLGRATKGAALALKARVLLYAASPLFNDAAKPNNDLEHGAYNPAKWENAAQAAAEVINLNRYSLYNSYANFFYTLSGNNEIIISKLQIANNTIEMQNGPSGYTGGQGGTCPTWEMASVYEMIDVTPFDWNNPEHAANPF